MHTTRYTSILLSFSVLLAVAGCGGDDDGGGGPPPAGAIAVEDFCAALADAACLRGTTCDCFGPMGAPMECVAAATDACPAQEGTPLRDEIASGARAWDADAAGRLVDTLRSAPCPDVRCAAATCIGLSASGGPCDGAELGCMVGDVCLDGRCVTPGADGEPCAVAAGCASGRCDGGTCMPKSALGAACGEDSECESGNCDFSTGRCAPLIVDGELCTESADCESGYCDRDLKLGAGSCQPLLPDGEACDEDIQCAGGRCASGTCGALWCGEIGP